MKSALIASSIFVVLISATGVASAKGCLKGAAVGGVAGHVAGHHSVVGAPAGCAIGRHRANKADKQKTAQTAVDARKAGQH